MTRNRHGSFNSFFFNHTSKAILLAALLTPNFSAAAPPALRTEAGKPVLADIEILEDIGALVLHSDAETGVGYARLSPEQEKALSLLAHERGSCGGFEALPENATTRSLHLDQIFFELNKQNLKNRRFRPSTEFFASVSPRPEIEAALNQVSEDELRSSVEFLSAFETRSHRSAQPNQAVLALKQRIEEKIRGTTLPYLLELVTHTGTKQNSLRLRFIGSQRPSEIVVFGAHLDSINNDWFGAKNAPGADDNASGSSNLLEAARILSAQSQQPERTLEFMWYAGEEGGLIGSSEISRDYKSRGVDVVAMLQLDMTLHPGDGEFTLGSMTDFTSAWLRAYLEELNTHYIKARIVNDKCGYGCSDHASWYRQGYPTLMPFEATFRGMNRDIHTTRDTIKNTSSFRHSAMFTKIALAIAMDLGNSTLREPK